MFSPALFAAYRSDPWVAGPVHHFAELESTNTWCRRATDPETPHGALCLADHQSAGRGQYQRAWTSAPAENLTFSVVWRPATAERLALLKQVCALAVCDTLTRFDVPGSRIKWPNDVLVDKRKLAGILVECTFLGALPHRVVAGIGLNVNQVGFPEELSHSATSMARESGTTYVREAVLAHLVNALARRYAQWERQDPALRNDIQARLIGCGEWCQIRVDGVMRDEPCKVLGVDHEGHLVVLDDRLRPVTFRHEDVRIDRPAEPLP